MSALAKTLRRGLFPLHVAVNKLDLAPEGVMDHLSLDVAATPCLADMELALRRADAAGLIRYRTGDVDFEVPEDAPLSDAQRAALERMRGALASAGGTGIEALLDAVVFATLERIVVYPVQDEGRWVDGDGRVLPDALVVPQASPPRRGRARAYRLQASSVVCDGRTRRVVGADHQVEDGDVLKIHAKT